MWILELLKFLLSFLPQLVIVEPDTRQVICCFWWTWTRKPGPRIKWPFYIAEQTDVCISHQYVSGFFVVDMLRTNWEATVAISEPIKYVYSITDEEDELIESIITRELRNSDEPDCEVVLAEYGIELIDLQTVQNGIPVISLNH